MINSFSTPPNDRFEGSLSRRKVFITIFKPHSSVHFAKQWQSRWESYKSQKLNPSVSITTDLNSKRLHIHEGLAKAESSLATQIRTGKIGLADFLYRRRVPSVTSPACPCGWYRQTAKHVIMFCPPLYQGRGRVPSQLSQTCWHSSNPLRVSCLLAQYSVAAEQLYG